MARGKYVNLEEARRNGEIDRFCKEHPSKGDERVFDALLDAMAHGERPTRKKSADGGTSSAAPSAGSSDTRTRQGTSGDA